MLTHLECSINLFLDVVLVWQRHRNHVVTSMYVLIIQPQAIVIQVISLEIVNRWKLGGGKYNEKTIFYQSSSPAHSHTLIPSVFSCGQS